MNYFTKEWYELCRKTSAYLLLEEEKEAESFSEKYFQQLYNQKLTEYLTLQEKVASYQVKHEVGKGSYIPHKPLLFDNSGDFTDIAEIQFENYKIIKQDALLQNSWWLYDEIYKKSGKYELHVLLQNRNMDLIEFTISAEHISFNHNQENENKISKKECN